MLDTPLVQSLGTQVAVIAATVLVLKQWIRSDINNLKEAQDSNREAQERVTTELHHAITKVADSVQQFVRTSTEERYRSMESTNLRHKDLELKVTKLEVVIEGLNNAMKRLADQMDVVLQRLPKNEDGD